MPSSPSSSSGPATGGFQRVGDLGAHLVPDPGRSRRGEGSELQHALAVGEHQLRGLAGLLVDVETELQTIDHGDAQRAQVDTRDLVLGGGVGIERTALHVDVRSGCTGDGRIAGLAFGPCQLS